MGINGKGPELDGQALELVLGCMVSLSGLPESR